MNLYFQLQLDGLMRIKKVFVVFLLNTKEKALVSTYSRNKVFKNFLTISPKLTKTKSQTHFC